MSGKVRLRLVKTLVLLALAFGVIGLPSAEAHYPQPCYFYAGCEYCACMEYRCNEGTEIPECGGNAACCSSAMSGCWSWCTWH